MQSIFTQILTEDQMQNHAMLDHVKIVPAMLFESFVLHIKKSFVATKMEYIF